MLKMNYKHVLSIALVLLFVASPSLSLQSNSDKISTTVATQKNAVLPSLLLTTAEQTWLAQHKTLRVAFDGHFPPYSFLDDEGNFAGLAVDVLQLVAARLDLRLEIFPQAVWKDLYVAAQSHEVDLVATMGRRVEREKWFTFTQAYIFKSLVIMTEEQNRDIGSPDDLAGQRVALVKSYQYVQPLLEKYPTIKPYYVDTMLDGLNAVAVGKADAVITFTGAGQYLKTKYHLTNLKSVAILERDSFNESIAVRNDWPELAVILDKALDSISAEEMLALNRRWLGPDISPGIVSPEVFVYLALILGGFFCLISAVGLWNRVLKKQVGRRTQELRLELTERSKAEAALRESSERFLTIFNAVNEAIFIQELDTGAILDANHTMCEMFDLSHEELLQARIEDLSSNVDPYTQDEARAWLKKALAGEAQHFEWQARKRDGSLFWLEVNMRRAVIGSEERVIVTAHDITERKQAEDEITSVNHDLRSLNRIIESCTTTLDIEELLNKVMDEALDISGLEGGTLCFVTAEETLHIAAHRATSETIIEDLSTHVVKVGDCLCGQCARDHKPLILADRAAVLEYSTREATLGEDIRFHAAFPLVSSERCLGVLCIFTRTDYKPSKKNLQLLETVCGQIAMAMDNAQLFAEKVQQALTLEEQVLLRTGELAEANERLKELDQLKSMFIASMSHELRTPLNSVIGFSSILLNEWTGPLNDEQKQNLSAILRSGKHLLALINDVIDISKIEAGMIEVSCDEFDLTELLTELEQSFSQQAQDRQLSLKVEMLALPMATDRRRLLQCLLNLVSNALKFTEQGQVRVAVKQAAEGVEISVTDSGIGISAEDQSRLFQAFSRIQSPLSAKVLGTGLGLYLTKKIVTEILQGAISVTSNKGQGSTFNISLPCRLKSKPLSKKIPIIEKVNL